MTSEIQDIPGDILLASASPRRFELLRSLGLTVEVMPSSYAEPAMPELTPAELALNHAGEKARDIASRFPRRFVVAADTVVDIDGSALGKPRDAEEALHMLTRLSGRAHLVHTSMALRYAERAVTHTETTRVVFFPHSAEFLRDYIATGESFDKAGGYGIQGRGALLVERIEGDFYTVMGFPLAQFARRLFEIGLRLPTNACDKNQEEISKR